MTMTVLNPKCDLCGEPADWLRPAQPKLRNLDVVGYRCDNHTPPWRVLEYEPLTLIARARREKAEAPLAVDEPKKPKKTMRAVAPVAATDLVPPARSKTPPKKQRAGDDAPANPEVDNTRYPDPVKARDYHPPKTPHKQRLEERVAEPGPEPKPPRKGSKQKKAIDASVDEGFK
jgi:hypothetical protein